MAKFYGPIGYGESVETKPGVWQDVIVEHNAYGDVLANSRSLTADGTDGGKTNLDVSVGNSISIVADAYANEHFFAIRYLKWQGANWQVSKVDVAPPRLVLRLGGLYHGPTA